MSTDNDTEQLSIIIYVPCTATCVEESTPFLSQNKKPKSKFFYSLFVPKNEFRSYHIYDGKKKIKRISRSIFFLFGINFFFQLYMQDRRDLNNLSKNANTFFC